MVSLESTLAVASCMEIAAEGEKKARRGTVVGDKES